MAQGGVLGVKKRRKSTHIEKWTKPNAMAHKISVPVESAVTVTAGMGTAF